MASAPRTKSADKQDSCKKVLAILKRKYSGAALPADRPVLETIIFAICLENSSIGEAEETYARLHKSFHDLNEIRVSSIDELQPVFEPQQDAEWRALRVRSLLQHLFESTYSFDFDGIKRKTLELATKQLAKIKSLTPFVRSYTLQSSLGAHVLPIDDRMNAALIWLDLAAPGDTAEHTGETLRGVVRKADGAEFCLLLRRLSLDSQYRAVFEARPGDNGEDDDRLPVARLEALLKGNAAAGRGKKSGAAAKKPPVSVASKAAARKKAPPGSKKAKPSAKKSTGKSASAKPPKKSAARTRR